MEDHQKTPASDRKNNIRSMFDSIAWRYDFVNHFLSAGTDRYWRNRAIRVIARHTKIDEILDVATGTADLAIAACAIQPKMITGIDISQKMLAIGREKVSRLGLSEKIRLIAGDSENIPFPDCSFDVAMVSFGVRNFADPVRGLSEMRRVLRKGGMIMVLEFSKPGHFPFNVIYSFYFRRILPFLGRILSGDKNAYRYLPESVMKFPDNEGFLELMRTAGFINNSQVKLTGGIASIYTGFKAESQ